jgi:hypothetical protein
MTKKARARIVEGTVRNVGDAALFREDPMATRQNRPNQSKYTIFPNEIEFLHDPAALWDHYFHLDLKTERSQAELMDLTLSEGWNMMAAADWKVIDPQVERFFKFDSEGFLRMGPWLILCRPYLAGEERRVRRELHGSEVIAAARNAMIEAGEEARERLGIRGTRDNFDTEADLGDAVGVTSSAVQRGVNMI